VLNNLSYFSSFSVEVEGSKRLMDNPVPGKKIGVILISGVFIRKTVAVLYCL